MEDIMTTILKVNCRLGRTYIDGGRNKIGTEKYRTEAMGENGNS